MAKPRATYLYTETRLNLDQATTSSTVELVLPDYDASNSRTPHNPERTIITRTTSSNEDAFSRENLASEGSIFFRRENRYPRTFLWRLLDLRKVLELQSVDLTQGAAEKTEALLTLRLRFPDAVRPFGVAFGDSDEKDALVVFAITKAGELYTITLHKDIFVHHKSSESLAPDWCKVFVPPAFRIREAFRLSVVTAHELFVSLSDGGLLRLNRNNGDNGSAWQETYFTPPGWNLSLPRALSRWKGSTSVAFGNIDLDPSTAASIELSPDGDCIYTICLNHTLRVWNTESGKIDLQTDLLVDDEQQLQTQTKFLIGPNQRQLLQVVNVSGKPGDKYYLVTYSPKQHQFSFWGVWEEADSSSEALHRIQPDFEFIPPIDDLMDTSAWNLEEFHIKASPGWRDSELWLRARSGPISKVFMVKFDLFESSTKELGQAWATQWCAVNPGRQSTDHLSVEVPADINNLDLNLHCPSVSEKWLEFLFYPDRFTTSTLATALHVYARGSTTSSSRGLLSDGKTPLKERICHAVSSKAVSSPADLQEISISEQWHVFYGLVRDLHKRRAVSLSFTIDPEELLPWVVSADFISPVRSCNDLDICDFHRTHEGNIPADDQVAKQLKTPYEILDFLHVAHVFRNSLSSTFDDDFNRAVLFELLQEPSTSVSDRMVALHEQCHIATHVSDEEWNRLRDAIDEVGGYDVLDYQNFCGILELLDQQPEGRQNKEQITRYGAKTLIRTAQETLALNKKTLMDLLLLVLFIEIEVDSAELASDMQGDWQGQDIFMEILAKLREIAVLDFLMSNVRTEQPKRSRQSISAESPTALRSSISGSSPIAVYTSTLMQSMFIGDWATIHVPSDDSLPELITYWARRWMSSEDITNQYESFTAHVLADLIKHDDEILATTFLPYVPTTGWSVYLRGRLNLLLGDFAMAATCFKKAAFSVSFSYFDVAQSDTADLLRPDERDLFCDGLHPYYRHILDLFTNVKAPSHIVEFAQIALQHLSLGARDVGVVSQPDHDKSVADLLSRLFTAALQTSQYDIAYSALTRLPPTNPLVRASLTSFITTLIQHNRVSLLLSYPFATGLSRTVDHVLASLAAKILNVASSTGPAYHKILYAFRVQRGDYRGGAQCLWDYLARLKDSGEGVRDPQDERLVDAYLTCINALRCCGEEDAWVLDDPAGNTLGTAVSKLSLGAGGTGATPKRKRKVVLLADVRREYQALLDRIAELESGKFAFGADEDEMDVEFL